MHVRARARARARTCWLCGMLLEVHYASEGAPVVAGRACARDGPPRGGRATLVLVLDRVLGDGGVVSVFELVGQS